MINPYRLVSGPLRAIWLLRSDKLSLASRTGIGSPGFRCVTLRSSPNGHRKVALLVGDGNGEASADQETSSVNLAAFQTYHSREDLRFQWELPKIPLYNARGEDSNHCGVIKSSIFDGLLHRQLL